jgi:hypothetical protein
MTLSPFGFAKNGVWVSVMTELVIELALNMRGEVMKSAFVLPGRRW